jgi:glycosyltransferase involved in cell wall biosynthesis
MTPEMIDQFEKAFTAALRRAVEEFKPDVLLCHHLFLLTALARRACPGLPVYGVCHGTDLRQLRKGGAPHEEFILSGIRDLDGIFALQEAQRQDILQVYSAEERKVRVVGGGFNPAIFFDDGAEKPEHPYKLIFAGKLSKPKGVESLLRAVDLLPYPEDALELHLAGGHGDEAVYRRIRHLADACKYKVIFYGHLPQDTELATLFRASHLMVLPSFYEGLALVILESLACGCPVLSTELPGVKDWMISHVPNNRIRFIDPPRRVHVDEPVEEDLPAYEARMASAIVECLAGPHRVEADLSGVTWAQLALRILGFIAETEAGRGTERETDARV